MMGAYRFGEHIEASMLRSMREESEEKFQDYMAAQAWANGGPKAMPPVLRFACGQLPQGLPPRRGE